MANLESTEIRKVIAKTEAGFASAELREGSNAAAKLLFANAPSAFSNLKAMKASLVQPTETILQKRTSVARAATKLAAHTGGVGDSFVQAIAFVQKSRTFSVSYKLAENNRFGYQEQLNVAMINAMMDLRGDINAYGIAQLAALKTQVSAGSGLLTWDGTNDKYTNATGDANVVKQASRIKATARKNKYGSNLDIIAGQQLVSDLLHNSAQGAANSVNYGYQFGGLSIAEEETLDESVLGSGGFGYVLPKGLVGMTSWNEGINQKGEGDVNDNEGMFTTIKDSVIPGLRHDVHVKRGLANTAVSGKTFYQDVVDEYEITSIYAFSHALISTADETPIFAFEQK